jgi:hypothetical protein
MQHNFLASQDREVSYKEQYTVAFKIARTANSFDEFIDEFDVYGDVWGNRIDPVAIYNSVHGNSGVVSQVPAWKRVNVASQLRNTETPALKALIKRAYRGDCKALFGKPYLPSLPVPPADYDEVPF